MHLALAATLILASATLGVVSSADDARSARAVPPFALDARGGFAIALADAPEPAPGASPATVATLPSGSFVLASEALASPLGHEITARVFAAADDAKLPLMQSGFVLSVSDLALAAAALAHAAANPRAWDPISDRPTLRSVVDRRPPRALFAWSPEELESLQDADAAAFAAGEAFVVAAARRRVLAPIAADRPELLPIDPSLLTLRAVEWAWAAARSCVEPAPVPGEPPATFEDPARGERPECVLVFGTAGEAAEDGVAVVRLEHTRKHGGAEVGAEVGADGDGVTGTIVADASLLRAAATTSTVVAAARVRVSDFSPRARTTKQRLFSRGDAPPVGSNPFDAATVTIDLANAAASVPGATRVAVAVADACDLRRRDWLDADADDAAAAADGDATAMRAPCPRVFGVEIESGSDDSDSGMGRAPPELVAAVGADGRPNAFAVAAAAVALDAESGVKKTRDVRRRLARRVAAGGVETKVTVRIDEGAGSNATAEEDGAEGGDESSASSASSASGRARGGSAGARASRAASRLSDDARLSASARAAFGEACAREATRGGAGATTLEEDEASLEAAERDVSAEADPAGGAARERDALRYRVAKKRALRACEAWARGEEAGAARDAEGERDEL